MADSHYKLVISKNVNCEISIYQKMSYLVIFSSFFKNPMTDRHLTFCAAQLYMNKKKHSK